MAKSIAVESKSGGMKEIRMIDFVKLTGARQWTHDGKMSRKYDRGGDTRHCT